MLNLRPFDPANYIKDATDALLFLQSLLKHEDGTYDSTVTIDDIRECMEIIERSGVMEC